MTDAMRVCIYTDMHTHTRYIYIYNMWVTGTLLREKKWGTSSIWRHNQQGISKLIKDINSQIEESQWTPSKMPLTHTQHKISHVITKLPKTKKNIFQKREKTGISLKGRTINLKLTSQQK